MQHKKHLVNFLFFAVFISLSSSILSAAEQSSKKLKQHDSGFSARGISFLRNYTHLEKYISVIELQHLIVDYLDSFDESQSLIDSDAAHSLDISHDGMYFATGPANSIRLWRYAPDNCKLLKIMPAQDLNYFSFLSDPSTRQSYLAIAQLYVKKFNGDQVQDYFEDNSQEINRSAYSHYRTFLKKIMAADTNTQRLACVSSFQEKPQSLFEDNYGINIWKKEDNNFKIECKLTIHTPYIRALIFSPDSKLLIVGHTTGISAFNLAQKSSYRVDNTNGGHKAGIYGLSFSPNGALLASASSDKTVKIWQIIDDIYICIDTLRGHTSWVNQVQFMSNNMLVSASEDKKLRVWKLNAGMWECSQELIHNDGVKSVAYSQKGKYIASVSCDKEIKIWLNTALLLREYQKEEK